jgi:CheY-like chemotaxis protein
MPESRPHILIVDDDSDMRRSLADALEESGYSVAAAANGEEALAILRKGPLPVVILLDLLMPVMNGWQFCQARREDPASAKIPIVVMSAAVSKDPASPYYIEVDDHIAKPIDLGELLAKLGPLTTSSPSPGSARL